MEEGSEGEGQEEAPTRWTCEACGCNTNVSTTDRCGICGTSNSGPSLLRRGGAAAYAARAGWFARSADSRARRAAAIMGADDVMDEDVDLWESVVHDDVAMESLVAASAVGDHSRSAESSRQRFLDAVRAFSQANREVSSAGSAAPVADANELLRVATVNASRYEPRWVADPATTLMGSRSRSGSNGIEVGDAPERRQSLAHLPMNAGEGRAIRAEEAFPRDNGSSSSNPFASFRMASELLASGMSSGDVMRTDNFEAAAQADEESTRRPVYGFRVAFDHPATGDVTGASMGGCYLVGVTTTSFSAYGEQNGLQQSPFFWGIEDGGQKYEGSRHSSGRRRGGAIYAVEIGANEAPMNAHGFLFGAREVITCVCDLESRTLTFWRDETLLGTLVSDLPRNVNLYPVAVPFNCGVTVAITGLSNDPLPLLRTFATDWRKAQIEKNRQTAQLLAEERVVLIKDGTVSPELRTVLGEIFRLYADDQEEEVKCGAETTLTSTMAARLWYRCGMKLASLETIMEAREDSNRMGLTLQDFVGVIEKVVAEDEVNAAQRSTLDVSAASSCEIGDKVELVDGYERYGDAASGPLLIGDRGVVVELQRGPNGEKRSVRVLFGGRRWWYQPQAIQSERSSLIASPGVWFLCGLLRSHGYDYSTLTSIAGKPVTATSWRFGDAVAPRKIPEVSRNASTAGSMIGYIVPETSGISSSFSGPSNRAAGTVVVEYTSRAFADAVGLKSTSLSSDAKFTIETRRVRTAKLVHARVDCRSVTPASGSKVNDGEKMETEDSKSDVDYLAPSVNENVQADIAALESLDRSAMEALLKECKKSPESLASLFSAGLPDGILSAINTAERLMNSLEPRDDLSEKLSSIGALVNMIAAQLYGDPASPQSDDDGGTMENAGEQASLSAPLVRNNQPGARRNIVREVLARRETQRDQNQDDSLASSQQQRRNILLSLMSRASRRSNAGAFLNEMAEALGEERELAFDQFPPSMSTLRSAPGSLFGSPSDRFGYGEMGWDDPQMLELAVAASGGAPSAEDFSNSESAAAGNDAESPDRSDVQLESSYLDSLLRCRRACSPSSKLSCAKPGGAAHSVFVRNLIGKGILVDNVEWASSLVDAYTRKVQLSSMAKTSSLLRDVVDEDGNPLLHLAIALGCSVDVIEQLISLGAAVGNPEIKRAAEANQVETLAVLLKHSSYKDGLINLEHCSHAVAKVLAETISRQDRLDRKMREVAGNFMVKLVQKLLKICLSARRSDSARMDMCGKVICEMLVGNVLLGALQKAQQSSRRPSAEPEHDLDPGVPEHGGRFPEDLAADLKAAPNGLLRTLPRVILGNFFFAEQGVTSFLLVVEEYLCSKEMNDIASGFSFLLIFLRSFPQLRMCSEIERFGISNFVASHSLLASNRIAEVLSNQFTNRLDVSAGGCDDSTGVSEAGIVVCPKKHAAVLHITRHSSFRCDVCGNGVDRGRPMHGCRICDWDLCEDCNPSGLLLKCTEVRELSSECHRLLSEDELAPDTPDEDFDFRSVLEGLEVNHANSSKELNELSHRLLRRDIRAAKDLGDRLNDPGQITLHQFLSIILPAVHASLMGRPNGDGAGHRSKKAKVIGVSDSSALDSLDMRLEFCRESLRYMVDDVKVSSSESAQATVGKESSEKSNEDKQGAGRVDITYCAGASEILRRIHQILSFNEGIEVFSSISKRGGPGGSTTSGKAEDLQILTKPIELFLLPSKLYETVSLKSRAVVYAEPLVPFTDLQLHVLRTFKVNDPAYLSFCRRLSLDNSIIIERPMTSKSGPWRVARIVAFDEGAGCHRVRYASSWKRGKEQSSLHLSALDAIDFSSFFRFTGSESDLILAARQYYIVFRAQSHASQKDWAVKDLTAGIPDTSSVTMDEGSSENGTSANRLLQAIGTRVESNCSPNAGWNVYTLIGTDATTRGNPDDETCFVLVSDEGEVFSGVASSKIRAEGAQQRDEDSRTRRTARGPRDDHSGFFPFFAARARDDFARSASETPTSLLTVKALRRTWSALSLADAMQPVNLPLHEESSSKLPESMSGILSFSCSLEESEFVISAEATRVELPPRLCVKLSYHENLPGIDLSYSPDKTLVWALKEIHQRQGKWAEWPPKSCRLYFAVKAEDPDSSSLVCALKGIPTVSVEIAHKKVDVPWPRQMENRSRKLCSSSAAVDDNDNNDHSTALCDGVNDVCIQCMECVNMISDCAEDRSSLDENDGPKLPGFANATLSKKLVEQLEDPVCVVGGALPDWCLAATSFAPRIFSYESRKALLERAAFGPSRGTLKQQEAKINVGRLRQRMASLRARAVELVGEAFSGGATDPTALQLQADELYGMEEALSTRVRAAFSAVKWQEHSIQVAKAAVRRDKLLADALSIMERYANDDCVSRRRLEVRFEGESGFDAASGDEAGVTRGFYADVAEALLSTDFVAGVCCSSACAPNSTVASPKDDVIQPMEVDEVEQDEDLKLPLWIPDMDSSAQVIIPTPRADPRSGLGVFPRPIPHYHPQLDQVLEKFRLIGRLFAAAMRDGFMFPLPLSASFLRLVQKAPETSTAAKSAGCSVSGAGDVILTTGELPRPGFIGGEIYAAEMFVCRALDRLDSASPPLSRHELKRRYEEIATDKSFAREALGKSYDCSFEEYFQDRVFVDPLDPAQGEDSVPLCPKGYAKPITIYNIREWVALAKNFILHDGVIAQALAFRRGVEDFFPPEYLSVFTAEELHHDVCGGGDQVDQWDESAIRKIFKLDGGKGAAEALVAVAAIGGEGGAALSRRFGPSSPTIGFLVKALLEASPKQRRQFLSFVTSVPIVTPGRIEVVPILSPSGTFLPMRDPGCLPRANTCARRLYLPKFETFETFAEVLWAVVREESRFKGFYEWRGS